MHKYLVPFVQSTTADNLWPWSLYLLSPSPFQSGFHPLVEPGQNYFKYKKTWNKVTKRTRIPKTTVMMHVLFQTLSSCKSGLYHFIFFKGTGTLNPPLINPNWFCRSDHLKLWIVVQLLYIRCNFFNIFSARSAIYFRRLIPHSVHVAVQWHRPWHLPLDSLGHSR